MMIKRPFLIFMMTISLLIAGLLYFIESPQFASIIKTVGMKYLPKDMGIQGNFSELSIRFVPPGFSIKNPEIQVEDHNIANLPPGSSVVAERMDFTFRLFQIFSGDIRIHEVKIINGQVHLVLKAAPKSPPKNPTTPSRVIFHWDELFQVKAESVALQNVKFEVHFVDRDQSVQGLAQSIQLRQWVGRGGIGYAGHLDITGLRSRFPKIPLPEVIDQVRGDFHLNALGVELESLAILSQGSSCVASGQIKGNLIDPRGLMAQLDIQASGDLEKFFKDHKFPMEFEDPPKGLLNFSGKITGNLEELPQSLQAEGHLQIKDFSYLNWKMDTVEVDAQWNGKLNGGELSLGKAVFMAREQARVGGFQPGAGGRVEIGPVKWAPSSTQPIFAPIRFQRAHIHWLGAPALKALYPMDFRLNGNVDVMYHPATAGKNWMLQAQLNSSMDLFQLDNQRYLKKKPPRALFKVPNLRLEGTLTANSKLVRTNDLTLILPHSLLRASGKFDFKEGYDLEVFGNNVNLSDLGQLSENEIRGTGILNARVHGPKRSVIIDLDVNLKDAFYLNLELGDLKGRLTWDDDPSQFVFNKIQLAKGVTHSIANGLLDFGNVDNKVDLNIQVLQGNIQDLTQVLDHLIQPLSWFPRSLKGPTHGKIKISGGLEFDKLQILSKLNGIGWDYGGEKFKTVYLEGGYDKGKYSLDSFSATKRTGKVSGKISFAADRKLDWDIESSDFTLNDFDHLVQLDVPIRGSFYVQSSGEGYTGAIQSITQLSLTDFSVRGVVKAPTYVRLETVNGGTWVKGKIMGKQGNIDGYFDDDASKLSFLQAQFDRLDFSPILIFLNPKTNQDRTLEGYISGDAKLKFRANQWDKLSGSFGISEYVLAKTGSKFNLEYPVDFKVSGGTFDTRRVSIVGKSGSAELTLKSEDSNLEGKIVGDIDNSLVEFFTPSVGQASGTSKLDFVLGGTLSHPSIFGRLGLEGGSVRLPSLDTSLENITGNLRLNQNVLKLQNIQTDLGGGKIGVQGEIVLNSGRPPEIAIKGSVSSAKLKVPPFQFVKTSGVLEVLGKEPPYRIVGNLSIDSALCREKMMGQKQKRGSLKALQYGPPALKEGENNAPKFKLNIDVEAKGGVVIQNDIFRDVQAKGSLTVINTLDTPRIVGITEITQGKVLFKDRIFQIQSATASFDNPTVINPNIDLNAYTDINGVTVGIYASGNTDNLKVEFTSNPSMQESEIFSLLTMGLTTNDAKKLNAADLNVLQQGEAASLVLHSLDFNRELEAKTGLQVQLDESVNMRQGASAFRPQSQNETTAAPQITIRKKLGDRLSLSAGSTVGVGTNKSNQVNMDYIVNRNLSISGVFNNTTGVVDNPAATQSTTQSNQNSFGLDVRFQKRFK